MYDEVLNFQVFQIELFFSIILGSSMVAGEHHF